MSDERNLKEEIQRLLWIVAVLTLKYQEAESEATVILPARSLGVYSAYDVKIEPSENATTIIVKVRR
jgi:hypothetical protein